MNQPLRLTEPIDAGFCAADRIAWLERLGCAGVWAGLSGVEKSVLVVLLIHAGGGAAVLPRTKIAELAGCDASRATRAVRALESRGLVARVPLGPNAMSYRFNVAGWESPATEAAHVPPVGPRPANAPPRARTRQGPTSRKYGADRPPTAASGLSPGGAPAQGRPPSPRPPQVVRVRALRTTSSFFSLLLFQKRKRRRRRTRARSRRSSPTPTPSTCWFRELSSGGTPPTWSANSGRSGAAAPSPTPTTSKGSAS